VKVDPSNASVIIAEQIIPESVGGWWVREIGLYDAAGDLVAIANCAPPISRCSLKVRANPGDQDQPDREQYEQHRAEN
jgi:hypothetical protein